MLGVAAAKPMLAVTLKWISPARNLHAATALESARPRSGLIEIGLGQQHHKLLAAEPADDVGERLPWQALATATARHRRPRGHNGR